MKSAKLVYMISMVAVLGVMQQLSAKPSQAKSGVQEAVDSLKMVSVIPYYNSNGEVYMLLMKESDNKLHTSGIERKENQNQAKLKDVLLKWIGEKYTIASKSLHEQQGFEKSYVSQDGSTINYYVKVDPVDAKEPEAQWLTYSQLVAQSKLGKLAEDVQEAYKNRQWHDIMTANRPAKSVTKSKSKSKSKSKK